MKFYNENKPLYLVTDASGVGPGTGLLQVRESIICPTDTPQTTPYYDQ